MHHSKTAALLWLISAFLFFSLFHIARRNSASTSSASDSTIPISDRRSALYEKMARDLDQKGPLFLKHSRTSQSLSLSDIFTVKDGSAAPVLKAANPPVRANVLYLSTHYSLRISEVTSGSDPMIIRAKLRTALPRAPENQLYDVAILHTSFARLLGEPKASSVVLSTTLDQIHFFHELVDHINKELQGFEAVITELWYVEKFDVLALALNGRMKVRKFQLGCSRH